ncbi:LmbE family N-acetylglucosaminyl deacetylase [Fontibacillus phaseoli]|uniref:LmbE family N-acetylglucosaminyl deacetylase n=1 Tax=Fontibacillus phaseoli TaxID=1416533 RepID=A0A369BN19_9BACL|nr:PIG-L family deacetylase [Fontibacillus phaseoli]RCX22990.1 LmbE family N-acetylglucosaminyl deacetylase [Fontibacillus phaseoli]
MTKSRTVAFIYAHPDDETFGCSYLIRQIADEGNKPILFTATRGDAGKTGHLGAMTREELATKRDVELAKAVDILGISVMEQAGMGDGKLKEVAPAVLQQQIADFLRRHEADVVVTFPEDGISGHSDHIVIHHAVNEVVFGGQAPSVQKLYYNQMGSFASDISSVIWIEENGKWEVKRRALEVHESQILSIERVFGKLGPDVPPQHRVEAFELAWEHGVHFPKRVETSIFDHLK